MAEELQSLLEKINSDGVKKANEQKEAILAAAEAEAKGIKAAAEAEAAALRKEAETAAADLQKRAESAIAQAARDVVLKLQSELKSRILAAVSGAAEEALTPAFMAELIRDLALKFAASPDAEISVLASVKDAPALDAALKGALVSSFRKAPRVIAEPSISGGMEISFSGGELYFDFSAEALTGVLASYTAPRIASIFEQKEIR